MNSQENLLQAETLSIAFPAKDKTENRVVSDINFCLNQGEVMAIVGESGSGKTMIARSILGLLPEGGFISGGSLYFCGQELLNLNTKQWRGIRGQEISMIFQEPMVSLNPTLKIGFQLCEAMRKHLQATDKQIWQRAVELLARVKIREPETCMHKYPHEFSGGMLQRIMIASSLMMRPKLLIADEPTTALDCIIQKEVLDILLEVTRQENTAVLLITHDLSLVAHYADNVLVMEKGHAVEHGTVKNILEKPSHPYTRKLLSSLPHKAEREELTGKRDPILEVKNLCVDYPIRRQWFWQKQQYKRILHNIDLKMQPGETLAIVGESGSGKTTLGRAILQLVAPSAGSVMIDGHTLTREDSPDFRAMSDIIQLVFQDPYASLSPRHTIGKIIAEPLLLKNDLSDEEIKKRTHQMLEEVGLAADFATRYPNELSGGQRQRVSIARALINRPKLIIADEPVSALDITVQAQVLELLDRLKAKFEFASVFISHDLSVVEQVADRVVVLYYGNIVEYGKPGELFTNPAHRYTRQLLAALPELSAEGEYCYKLHTRHHPEYQLPEGYKEITEHEMADKYYLKLSDDHYVACLKTN